MNMAIAGVNLDLYYDAPVLWTLRNMKVFNRIADSVKLITTDPMPLLKAIQDAANTLSEDTGTHTIKIGIEAKATKVTQEICLAAYNEDDTDEPMVKHILKNLAGSGLKMDFEIDGREFNQLVHNLAVVAEKIICEADSKSMKDLVDDVFTLTGVDG